MPGTNLDVVIDTHGLEKKLLAKGDQLQSKIQQMHRLMLTDAQRDVQKEAPRRTGRLKSAVQYKLGGNSGQIFINKGIAPYCDWVIDGRGPVHAIKAKALHFFINGQEFFRTSVGPSKPNPFVDKAVPEVEQQIEGRLNTFLKWLDE